MTDTLGLVAPHPSESPAPAPAAAASTPAASALDFTPQRFVVWVGGLAVLWLILSALADSGNVAIARGLAALLIFGAVIALGPRAIANAKTVF